MIMILAELIHESAKRGLGLPRKTKNPWGEIISATARQLMDA
jgi:hypothetical protein